MKYIAIFLFLANVSYFVWLNSPYAEPISLVIPEPRPLLNNGMTMLDEFKLQTAEYEQARLLASKTCLLVEGFSSTEEAELFITQANDFELAGEIAMNGPALPSQYRVYLAPSSSRAVATIVLDGLMESAAAIDLALESYLITRGSLENAIALGVFESRENAQDVQNQVASLGYEPRIEEVLRSELGFLVRLESSSPLSLVSTEWLDLSQERPELIASENLCETIAQGEQFP